MKHIDILIIGAGPTGLGAAWRLHELGNTDWMLLDQNPYPGGLAASFKDDKGFIWDFAVHVAHSHYAYFDRLMETLLPDGFYHHQRKSWVRLYDTWVPYPFQYNFHRLPPAARAACLNGLRERQVTENEERKTKNDLTFLSWILANFGQGIADHFMIPYNRKIWTVDPGEMNSHWLGDRVPTVDMERVERNVREGIDEVGWGPNATFQFPKRGGTGAIWKELFRQLPAANTRLACGVQSIDAEAKVATLDDGTQVAYQALVSTMPLKVLARMLGDQSMIEQVSRLKHSHVQVAGVGVFRPIPEELADKTWVYCPEDKARFYRITPFSTFSPDHTPDPENCCSFLCEFAAPGDGPRIKDDVGEMSVEGMRALGLMDVERNETHIHTMRAEYGYPVPTLDRDVVLHEVLPALERMGIYSRGRFGGWKYEVANMDHSVMQGVEAVDHILTGADQPTIYRPAEVNA